MSLDREGKNQNLSETDLWKIEISELQSSLYWAYSKIVDLTEKIDEQDKEIKDLKGE